MIGLPTETHVERWETVDILAQSRTGRFRTSWFFPFPGKDSYHMTIEGSYFNSRMERFHDSPASKRYHALVADVLRMTRDEWEASSRA